MWKIFDSQDGTTSVLSERYGVSYHSKYGALRESRHVFIEAGLYYRSLAKKELAILEMGFGTGLNALLTFLESKKLGLTIDYTTIELFPLPMSVVSQLNFAETLQLDAEDHILERLHEAAWGTSHRLAPHFSLLKLERSIENADLSTGYDVIYYDAFAPSVQPELWEEPILRKMYEALQPGGLLVTYCAKGSFKRALRSAGFEVESLKGPPGKREMTRAVKRSAQQG